MIPADFPLHVPKGNGTPLVAALQMIPANHLDAWRMHRVGSGETLATIGKRYGVTPSDIVSVNRLESAQALEGDRLLIPSVQRVAPPVAKKPLSAAARRRGTRTTTAASPQDPGCSSPRHRQLISGPLWRQPGRLRAGGPPALRHCLDPTRAPFPRWSACPSRSGSFVSLHHAQGQSRRLAVSARLRRSRWRRPDPCTATRGPGSQRRGKERCRAAQRGHGARGDDSHPVCLQPLLGAFSAHFDMGQRESRTTDSRKRAFFCVDSSRVNRVSAAPAPAEPGNPAPDPASATCAAPRKRRQGNTESTTCLMAASPGSRCGSG